MIKQMLALAPEPPQSGTLWRRLAWRIREWWQARFQGIRMADMSARWVDDHRDLA